MIRSQWYAVTDSIYLLQSRSTMSTSWRRGFGPELFWLDYKDT